MKTEHNGAKNGGGMWDTRANAKRKSSKARRAESKKATAQHWERWERWHGEHYRKEQGGN